MNTPTKDKDPAPLVEAFQDARAESRKLQAQARKTNKALAVLDEQLAMRGIKLTTQEKK